MGTWLRGLSVALFALGALVVATCGGREETFVNGDSDPDVVCGPDPRACDEGMIGTRCSFSDDCEDGICCLSSDCGGGTCTYLCGSNADCPFQMLCEGGFCFFKCTVDTDCGPGQHCEHDQTVCQY